MSDEVGRLRVTAVVWAVLLTALVSAGIIHWGPEPTAPVALFDDALGQLEPRDRWWYVAWLVLPPVLALGLTRAPLGFRALCLGVTLLAGGALALLAGVVADAWFYGWSGYGPVPVAFGLVAAWGLERHVGRAWLRRGLGVLAALWCCVAACVLWQTPDRTVDPFHFAFLSDDMFGFLADPPPLRGYVPTYTALLGAPLALPVRLFGWEPLAVACAWLWGLTLATGALVATGLARVGGRRWLWLYLLVVSTVPLLNDRIEGGVTLPLGLIQPVWPTRLVVPAATFCAFACWRARRGQAAAWPGLLGALGALGVLCNADFGLVNMVAITAAVALLAWREGRLSWPVAFAVGAGLVIGGHAVAYIAVYGGPPDLAGLATFIWMFGAAGYGNVSMPVLGLHTVAASFATLCLWVAVGTREPDARVELLGLAALLALGTIAYYVGRSYTVNLAAGAGLWLATCAALWVTLRAERPDWPCPSGPPAIAPVLRTASRVPLAVLLAGLMCQQLPTEVPPGGLYPPGEPPPAGLSGPAAMGGFTRDGHLWAWRRGLPVTLTVDHPSQLGGPVMGDCYCEALARQGRRALVVQPGFSIWLQLWYLSRLPACRRVGITAEAIRRVPRSEQLARWVVFPLVRERTPPPSR